MAGFVNGTPLGAYTDGMIGDNGTLRVYYNPTHSIDAIRSVDVYAYGAGMEKEHVGSGTPHALFASVPGSELAGKEGLIWLEVEITSEDGERVVVGSSEQFEVLDNGVVTNENLSVTNDAVENEILKRLAFPLNNIGENGHGWYNAADSPWHTNNNSFSVDINLTSWGNTDEGEPVFAAASGTVIDIDQQNYGRVLIEHSLITEENGQTIETTWQTRYLHMDIDPAFIQQWQDAGQRLVISAGDHIGSVGRWGDHNPTGFTAHLDFTVYAPSGSSIDLSNWLSDKLEFQLVPENGDLTKIIWSANDGLWIKEEDDGTYWDAAQRTFLPRL